MQKPEIGDTLVCRNGVRYVCCSSDDLSNAQKHWADVYITEYGGYLGKGEDNSEWMHWTTSLRSRTSNPEWDIVEIRSNKPKFNPKPGESTLEFRIRVLEKENQMLARLLMKDGKL